MLAFYINNVSVYMISNQHEFAVGDQNWILSKSIIIFSFFFKTDI